MQASALDVEYICHSGFGGHTAQRQKSEIGSCVLGLRSIWVEFLHDRISRRATCSGVIKQTQPITPKRAKGGSFKTSHLLSPPRVDGIADTARKKGPPLGPQPCVAAVLFSIAFKPK